MLPSAAARPGFNPVEDAMYFKLDGVGC